MISCLVDSALALDRLQVLHQVADGEVRRIALTVVAVFLAELEGRDVRHRHDLATIAAAFEDCLDYAFVLPGKSAEEDGDFAALFRGKGTLDRALKVAHRTAVQSHHARQPSALLRQLALNLFLTLRTRQFVNREVDASNRHMSVTSSSSEMNFCFIVSDCLDALEWCGAGVRRVCLLQRRPKRVRVLTAQSIFATQEICYNTLREAGPGQPLALRATLPHNLLAIIVARSHGSKRHMRKTWQSSCTSSAGTCVPTHMYTSPARYSVRKLLL